MWRGSGRMTHPAASRPRAKVILAARSRTESEVPVTPEAWGHDRRPRRLAAVLLVKRYGDDALLEAAERADQRLDEGDMAGAETWHRILKRRSSGPGEFARGQREGALKDNQPTCSVASDGRCRRRN